MSRDGKGKASACILGCLDPDQSLQSCNQTLANSQTHAVAISRQALKGLKDMWTLSCRNILPPINHINNKLLLGFRKLQNYIYRSKSGTTMNRIFHQMKKNALQLD